MKKNYSSEKRKKITVTIDNELLMILDNHTSNRSNIMNMLLKEYFEKMGFDTKKIKL